MAGGAMRSGPIRRRLMGTGLSLVLLGGLAPAVAAPAAQTPQPAASPKPNPMTMSLAQLLAYAASLKPQWGPVAANSVLILALNSPGTRLSDADRLAVKNQIALNCREVIAQDHQSAPYREALPQLAAVRTLIGAGRYAEAETKLTALYKDWRARKAAGKAVSNVLAEIDLGLGSLALIKGDNQRAFELNSRAFTDLSHANNLDLYGDILIAMGYAALLDDGYGTALNYADMALETAARSMNSLKTADADQFKGELFLQTGKADEAKGFLLSAVQLAEEHKSPRLLPLALLLAQSCISQNQPEQARDWLKRAEPLFAGQSDVFARNLSQLRMARVLMQLPDLAAAETHFLAAREGFHRLGLTYYEILALEGLSELYLHSQPQKGLTIAREMLTLAQAFGERSLQLLAHRELGWLQLSLGQNQAAVESFAAVMDFDSERHVPAEVHNESLEQRTNVLRGMVKAYLALDMPHEAFERAEASKRGDLLAGLHGSSNSIYLASDQTQVQLRADPELPRGVYSHLYDYEVRNFVPPAAAALSYAQTDDKSLALFAISPLKARMRGLTLPQALAREPLYTKYAAKLQLATHGQPDFDRLAQIYRQLLSRPSSDSLLLRELGHLLYRVLIAPEAAVLAGAKSLIVIPDGALALIPFESLVDDEGHYLVENFDIQYGQSFDMLFALGKRDYAKPHKPLLALGDAHYAPQTYALPPIESEAELLALKRRVWSMPDASMHNIYGALYEPQWSELPGSGRELDLLARLIPGTEQRRGDAVNEAEIKTLSQNGELARYSVLHWAVHGLAVPEIPELSALVLTQPKQLQTEDNYLRMPEIAQLRLEAEFVNLSACETGLGKIFRGQGVIGLTQAFLTAGANRVSVALWQIDDRATSRFMESFYTGLAQSAGSEYRARLNQTKRAFLAGKFGKKFAHPAYWAPFVLYGKL